MTQQSPRHLELTVTTDQAGERIDTLLRRELRLLGTMIRRVKWLNDGILLDRMRITTACHSAAGQVLSVRMADPDDQGDMMPTPDSLDIVHGDEDLLILGKAPGVLVHPDPGHCSDTLCNYIAWYYKRTGISADVHPVQRLDKSASGLLAVAKHPHAQEQLRGQLRTPAFRRIYLTVCGEIPQPLEGRIDIPIGRVPGSLMARQVDPAGQPAFTRYRVFRTGQGRALVEPELDTGRIRQIRVYTAHISHPLTGDFLYGTEDHSLISHPTFHSARFSLRHPITGEPMAWEQPLPEDMTRLV